MCLNESGDKLSRSKTGLDTPVVEGALSWKTTFTLTLGMSLILQKLDKRQTGSMMLYTANPLLWLVYIWFKSESQKCNNYPSATSAMNTMPCLWLKVKPMVNKVTICQVTNKNVHLLWYLWHKHHRCVRMRWLTTASIKQYLYAIKLMLYYLSTALTMLRYRHRLHDQINDLHTSLYRVYS